MEKIKILLKKIFLLSLAAFVAWSVTYAFVQDIKRDQKCQQCLSNSAAPSIKTEEKIKNIKRDFAHGLIINMSQLHY